MKEASIKHVWFDFSDTIGKINRDIYNEILYSSYAKAVGKEVNEKLKEEYAQEFQKYKSNSAVFSSLGLPAGHLADCMSVVEPNKLYTLTDENIPSVIQALKIKVPVSIFSNNKLDVILPALGIDLSWFTFILGPNDVKNPKPALDGFKKMIERSQVQPNEILYVGDDVHKDLLPAKQVGILTGILWKQSDEADYCFKDFQAILDLFP
jgi:HAD superfamily hydrolase (TIGR01549 family)